VKKMLTEIAFFQMSRHYQKQIDPVGHLIGFRLLDQRRQRMRATTSSCATVPAELGPKTKNPHAGLPYWCDFGCRVAALLRCCAAALLCCSWLPCVREINMNSYEF
jgi:hypothetical protein